MRHAAKARLDAAKHDGRVLENTANEVRVHNRCMVGPPPRLPAGRVGILATTFLRNRVVVHHGVHVASGNEEGKPRLAENGDALRVVPIRLSDDAHAITVRFEQTPDDGRAKGGVVDVSIARDVDEVELFPTAGQDGLARHGQELGLAPARRRLLFCCLLLHGRRLLGDLLLGRRLRNPFAVGGATRSRFARTRLLIRGRAHSRLPQSC